ncbi:MAG: glycosyltransferase [Solirubrobacteraceae bacterium]
MRPDRDAAGDLDSPSDGAVVEGDVLHVRGWCLFEGSRVARVEVVVDGRSLGLARPYIDRPDVADHYSHPDAPVAGFEMLISFERRDRNTASLVTVEASSLDGRRWRSETHRVSWAAQPAGPAHRGELLVRRSTAAVENLRCDATRVLVFTHDLSYGGGQLWLVELLRQLTVASSLDCTVVSVADGPLRARLEDLGIGVHITALWRMDDVEAYEGRIHELALLIRASGAGAVLVNTLGVFPAVDAAARAGIPSLWAIHESFEPAVYRYMCWGTTMHPHVRSRFDACFRSARALIFEARQTADLFAHLCSPEQRLIVDYGVDREAIDAYRASLDRSALRHGLGFDDDSVVLVVVGTLEPRKAQAAVFAAFDELAIVHDRLRLALVGCRPGSYSEALTEQLARCAAADRVVLVPITPDIYRWYAVADLLVCASDIESLPLSILEAMAFELPVVSTDAFGIADLIDDARTGWLTRSRDLEGLVGLLHLVLRLPAQERRAVGARARAEVLRRDGDRSYGRVFARVLCALLEDPSCDLTVAFSNADARGAGELTGNATGAIGA